MDIVQVHVRMDMYNVHVHVYTRKFLILVCSLAHLLLSNHMNMYLITPSAPDSGFHERT